MHNTGTSRARLRTYARTVKFAIRFLWQKILPERITYRGTKIILLNCQYVVAISSVMRLVA